MSLALTAPWSPALKATGFDYADLDADLAEIASATAARINSRMHLNILDTGRDLAAIKAKLPHGQFGLWLAAEFDMSKRTAERYMKSAELADSKSDIVSHLASAALLELAAPTTPADVQDTVIGRLKAGERVSSGEVRALVSAEAARIRIAKNTPEQNKKIKEAARRRELAAQRADAKFAAEMAKEDAIRDQRVGKVADFLRSKLNADDIEHLESLMMCVGWHDVSKTLSERRRMADSA